jgi:hypothetical protein
MPQEKISMLDPRYLWSSKPRTPTAFRDLDAVLGAVVNLPIKYWRPNFFFSGAPDDRLSELSGGGFPAVTVPGKSHPVFTLHPVPDHVGFAVCPCSSKRPFDATGHRFIGQGCRLKHTGHVMDRNSYLVEKIRLNIPSDTGYRLRFRGEVPEECIQT